MHVNATSTFAEGSLIDGRYETRAVVGEGAFGTVYQAYDRELSRLVAVKVINDANVSTNPAIAKRLVREAQALSLLKHPGVIEVYRIGFLQDGRPFLVMEFVESESLDAVLRKNGPFYCRDAADICSQLAQAVSHAHAQGVLHRDIKPQNVLLKKQNSGWQARLVDFGLSSIRDEIKQDQSKLTMTGAFVGTPNYMSPEQCRGEKPDERSDIYSLGLVFFEMLAGKAAYTAESPAEVLLKQVSEPLPKLAELDPDAKFPELVQAILDKATQKNIDQRYQTVSDMALDLHLLAEKNITSKINPARLQLTSSHPQMPNFARRPVIIAAVIAGVVVLVASLGLLTSPGRKTLGILIINLLPPRQAVKAIVPVEDLERRFGGASGELALGQTALDAVSGKAWTAQERFDLCWTIFKNAGGNRPIEKFYPLALTIFDQGNLVFPVYEIRNAGPDARFLIHMAEGKFQGKTPSATSNYIDTAKCVYVEPLIEVTEYLLDSRLSQKQWHEVNKVCSRQSEWRGGLSRIEDARTLRLCARSCELTANSIIETTFSRDQRAAAICVNHFDLAAQCALRTNDPRFDIIVHKRLKVAQAIGGGSTASWMLTAVWMQRLGRDKEAYEYYMRAVKEADGRNPEVPSPSDAERSYVEWMKEMQRKYAPV